MPGSEPNSTEPRLTSLQRQFVENYLGVCRGDSLEACRLAGISEDPIVLRRAASRLLNHPAVRFHIEKWASKHIAPTEILSLLASHARGDMLDFWDVTEAEEIVDPLLPPARLNLRKAAELGVTHLIKKLKIGKDGAIELELYDAQAALGQLIKIHGMQRHDSNVRFTIEHVLRALPEETRNEVLNRMQGIAVGELPPHEEDLFDAEAIVADQNEDRDNLSRNLSGYGDEENFDVEEI